MSESFIMHIDMDAFYASIEQMDHPEWKGKPVIVGGNDERGVVSTASYEARRYGIHSAMPAWQARRRCPCGIFVLPNMQRYKEISDSIHECLNDISPLVEMASIDEAYLDLTGITKHYGSIERAAQSIKQSVKTATGGLSCSVGVAPLKFLAKICSEEKKPDGLFILPQADMQSFLSELDVCRIPGVGKKFSARLDELGIKKGRQVLALQREFWERRFGKSGISLFDKISGIDPSKVIPYAQPKSESAECTLSFDTDDAELLRSWLLRHAERIGRRIRRQGLSGKTITLKIKYADFSSVTKQTTLDAATDSTETMFRVGCALLDTIILHQKVRLIGLGISNFENEKPMRIPLLHDHAAELKESKNRSLDQALDSVRNKYGEAVICRGRLFGKRKN